MSAAAPLPPPYSTSSQQLSSSSSSSSAKSNGSTNGSSAGSERVFAHIEDLKVDALADINPQRPINQLFELSEQSLTRATSFIQFRRPDQAFVYYLRSYEIAVGIIPVHWDIVSYTHDKNGGKRLAELNGKIFALDEEFKAIKSLIISNNKQYGTLPREQKSPIKSPRPTSLIEPKIKPAVSPKPEKLHSRPISTLGNGKTATMSASTPTSDVLSDRFAKLRTFNTPDILRPDSRASNSSASNYSFLISSNSEIGDSSARSSFHGLRPHGPRDMPDVPATSKPLVMPLDTQIAAAMPKPPSPTYSPARNMQTTGNIAPPRHSARSLVGNGNRKTPITPSSSISTFSPSGPGDYFPTGSNDGAAPIFAPRRRSVNMLKDTSISAERLYDYLERFNILLIDFRPRAEFDQGHIYSRNVICIDPPIIRNGMSAEELSDRLVISPSEEQEMFYKRDKFDLVVYYDTRTDDETYLTHPRNEVQTRLKFLHESLYEFNQDKPLQRPPILLKGGLDAWVDLMGNQALIASSTQAKVKQGRPIQRRTLTRDGQLRAPKRRLRDFNPLDAEEEQSWRARAQSESVPEPTDLAHDADNSGDLIIEVEDAEDLPDYPTIEAFNARFPDAGSLGKQMAVNVPSRIPPVPPAKLPEYPNAPSVSVYPPIPARPPPTAPRMSYTGVSDRAVSQNLPPPRTSSQLAPYIPSKYLSANLRLPRTGIYNFGNTCYMNATLQALSATTPLTVLFLDDQFKNLVQKENWKGSRGLLPDIYSNFVRSLWKGDVNFIKPSTFRTFCGRLNSMFSDPSQQQDAQEFFSFLVDTLHEDFNAMWARTPLRLLTEQEEMKRERMPRMLVARTEWGRWAHRESSLLTSLFYGQQSSRLRCQHCGSTSTTYEPWAILPVEIPENAQDITVEDCLRSHMQDELLDESNQWECPKCKVHRKATKKFTITRMPPFLVLQLKRFITNPRSGEQRKRLNRVQFPLTGLDMEEFVLPQPSPQEAQDIATQYGAESLKTDLTLTPPYIYDAYAVVRHHGKTTRSGHYTCAVKDRARGCWRYFNDQTSQDFQPETLGNGKELDNEQAYMIFYQRRLPNEQRQG